MGEFYDPRLLAEDIVSGCPYEEGQSLDSLAGMFASSDLGPDQGTSLCEPRMSPEEGVIYLSDWIRFLQASCKNYSKALSNAYKRLRDLGVRPDGTPID